jgi:hypothetical protein
MIEWVNSTIIHCKNYCKCHNVTPIQLTKYISKIQNLNIGVNVGKRYTCTLLWESQYSNHGKQYGSFKKCLK